MSAIATIPLVVIVLSVLAWGAAGMLRRRPTTQRGAHSGARFALKADDHGAERSSPGAVTLMELVQRPRRFTLIELLVVVSIIGILASMLLPAMAKARLAAKTTADKAAYKQQAAGYLMYTDDYADEFPMSTTRTTGAQEFFADNQFFSQGRTSHRDFDRRTAAADYAFMAVTSCIITGAPAWDDEGNTGSNSLGGTRLGGNRRYYPASFYNDLTASEKAYCSPSKVTQSGSSHVMLSSVLKLDPVTSLPIGVYVRDGQFKDPATGNISSLRYIGSRSTGVVAARADGSVEWVTTENLVNFTYSSQVQFMVPNNE